MCTCVWLSVSIFVCLSVYVCVSVYVFLENPTSDVNLERRFQAKGRRKQVHRGSRWHAKTHEPGFEVGRSGDWAEEAGRVGAGGP